MNSIPRGYILNEAYTETIPVSEGDEVGLNPPADRPSSKGCIICFNEPVNANSRVELFYQQVTIPIAVLKPYESFLITNNQQFSGLAIRGVTDGLSQNTVSVTYLINAVS
jgi:hypothetical protein